MARTLVFDVNETLLDLRGLDPVFERLFGDAAVRREWFSQVLQWALVATVLGRYHRFTDIGAAALQALADRYQRTLGEADKAEVAATMRRLPPHPEVPEALERLKTGGLRLAALTNSPPGAMQEQLQNAGLAEFFERQLSVDQAGRLKPAPEPYRMAASELGIPPANMRMVAAHGWDLAGASAAGCATAFVARPGQSPDPFSPPPDLSGSDLLDLAEKILIAEAQAP
ncbi:haloacid dehalogenase type II [Thiohalorhabdus methylotrophus]|uniref:(S)-2-haloacid dehalogenase n=1 Tax=Thiohalorhabdus methylotrophus TaxID=3242694 RepID=A0ABV4TRI0_9GAMM